MERFASQCGRLPPLRHIKAGQTWWMRKMRQCQIGYGRNQTGQESASGTPDSDLNEEGVKFQGILVALIYFQRALAFPQQNLPGGQYHIQTDQGPERFFRFQTATGQYRKENLHQDGSVTGSYGWVDPNGVLRLFDYVSDAGGYRIERTRKFKVGTPVSNPYLIPVRGGGNIELGFEVYPLDLESDPHFGFEASPFPVLGGNSGLKQLHVVDGNFGVSDSFQVSSLTSTHNDVTNPVSKQAQATEYHANPIVIAYPPPPPPPPTTTPKPKIVIGAAFNPRPKDEPAQRSTFVIGASHDQPTGSAAAPVVASNARAAAPPKTPARRRGIVIGRTARMLFL